MGLMGLLSLAFSYRSAMKKYTGVDSKTRKKKKVTQAEPGLESKYLLRRLPLVSDQVSAVALSTHRSTLRAPESKMLLVLPVILFVLGMTFYMGNDGLVIPSAVRPFLPIGLITMTMFSLTGMLCNQFGMDRDGFRCFMLSPIDRVDIFIGKNIGLAPLARIVYLDDRCWSVCRPAKFLFLPGDARSNSRRVFALLHHGQYGVDLFSNGNQTQYDAAGQSKTHSHVGDDAHHDVWHPVVCHSDFGFLRAADPLELSFGDTDRPRVFTVFTHSNRDHLFLLPLVRKTAGGMALEARNFSFGYGCQFP